VRRGFCQWKKALGVILAGGDGTRLQTLTRFICGDQRPKQFCPLFDGRTLLAHTVCRAERNIPPAQILFALTHGHREFYVQDLEDFESQRIVQPANKGTAPAILFSVLSIEGMDDDALIAILPSDHYYSDESRFTAALDSAFEIAAERPESVVLIGAEPDRPEVEYGWIALGASAGAKRGELHHVRAFLEKPTLDVAQTLLGEHSAWSTFVMVGHVRAFLEMVAQAIPNVLKAVRRARLWTGFETHIEESVYSRLPSTDFSGQVLSLQAGRLLVLRVRGLGWSDLGHPGRVLTVLEGIKLRPRWWRRELRKGMQRAYHQIPNPL
jgi:mannose-1-phosphate guanylyltransferase